MTNYWKKSQTNKKVTTRYKLVQKMSQTYQKKWQSCERSDEKSQNSVKNIQTYEKMSQKVTN